jgi:phospholipase/carboxylesterase
MVNPLEIRSLMSHFVPAQKAGPDRLLLVMHGLGDSLEGFRFLPKMLDLPGLHYLLVNAPDPYFTGFSWFDLYGAKEEGIVRSRGLLFEVMDEVRQAGWKCEDVGLFGFSQGCLMVLDLACRYPEAFGGVVGVSGFVAFQEQYPEAFSPAARSQRILMTHGTGDPLLPLETTRRQANALQGMGLKLDFKAYEKEHTIDPRQEVGDIREFLRKTLIREGR